MGEATLYDEDFLLWTEQQAAAIRNLPLTNKLDVDHLAEEIEDLGKRELRKVESLVEQMMLHALKVTMAPPGDPTIPHWRGEISVFQRQAVRSHSPSMTRLLDLDGLWAGALASWIARGDLDGMAADRIAALQRFGACPMPMNDLLGIQFSVEGFLDAVARLYGRSEP